MDWSFMSCRRRVKVSYCNSGFQTFCALPNRDCLFLFCILKMKCFYFRLSVMSYVPFNTLLFIHSSIPARWNHIEDLDSFFNRLYCYHQKHGFYVMMLQKVFELFQFMFVVVLITYMINCIDYSILFKYVIEEGCAKLETLSLLLFPAKRMIPTK